MRILFCVRQPLSLTSVHLIEHLHHQARGVLHPYVLLGGELREGGVGGGEDDERLGGQRNGAEGY